MRIVLALCAALLAPAALAAPLPDLVEERARVEYADALPEEGRFDVSLEGDLQEAAMLAEFWMDPGTGQFLANAVTDAGEVRRISGRAIVTVAVPVPTRKLLPGAVLSEADLRFEDMPMGRVAGYSVLDPADLIGKEVRRVLTPGRPVQAQSVREPLVVARGGRVEIRLSDGALGLKAPGRALEDAHRGQEVRIVNLVSNTSLTAIATAPGVVEVMR